MSEARPIAVIVPVEDEFRPYPSLLPDLRRRDDAGPWELYEARVGKRPLLLLLSHAGPVNAAAATERLVAGYAPVAVLNAGSAGAHNPELLPGDVVLGSRYTIFLTPAQRAARIARGLSPTLLRFRRDGAVVALPHVEADADLFARAHRLAVRELAAFGPWDAPGWPADVPRRPGRIVSGVVASADAWTIDAEELRSLREDVGAECEDMESAYVAQVCAMHGLPFLAVRVISDNEAACLLTADDVGPAIRAAGERAARIVVALAASM